MCTISIHRTGERLLVTMNRDEARTRGPELPPAVSSSGRSEPEWLAPRDSDRGGTWIAVNTRGVVACLSNGYLPDDPAPGLPGAVRGARSRGEIVPRVMKSGTLDEVRKSIGYEIELAEYPSFKLVAATRYEAALWFWRGSGDLDEIAFAGPWGVVSSSAWRTAEVDAWRVAEFERWRSAGAAMAGTLPSFHLMQREGMEEWGPLTDRPFSNTRSITQVEVDATHAIMRYWPRPAIDEKRAPTEVVLDLQKSDST